MSGATSVTRDIVVFGGSGFIGTRLVENLLQAGNRVRIADKVRSEAFPELWKQCDVRDRAEVGLTSHGCDVIYNLAAEFRDGLRPASLYYDVSVDGARNVCDAALDAGIETIVFTSSASVYAPSNREIDENSPPGPISHYGRSKLQAEQIYEQWRRKSSRATLVTIRPCVVFGENNHGYVYDLVRHIARRRFLMIGSGSNRKSMAYVGNVADFLVHCLSLPPDCHLFNYADKPDFDMNGLLNFIQRELDTRLPIEVRLPYLVGYTGGLCFDAISFVARRRMAISSMGVKKFCANSQFLAERALQSGFTPAVKLEDGLKQMIHYEFSTS